jgi:hypothetical protein
LRTAFGLQPKFDFKSIVRDVIAWKVGQASSLP